MKPAMAANKTKKALVPKLRFKGFGDEWKPTLLGSTCRVTTGNKDTQNRVDDGAFPFFVRSNTVERINSYSFDGEAILTSGDGVGVGKNFHYINGKFDFHQRVYALLDFKKNYYGKFIYQLFVEKFYKRVMRLSAKNSVDSVRLNMITEMNVCFPTLPEQQKIAVFLSALDEKIQQLTRKKELLEQYKKGVMQQLLTGKLRFKDSNGKAYPKWEERRLGDVLDYIQPTKYLVESTEYDNSYSTPVLTAGKTFILGYTNETKNIYNQILPVILFDDFTTATQFVDFPFKAKSSAMKILVPKQNENILFLYEVMQLIKFEVGGHGRHWISQFALLNIPYPCIEEQQKISEYLKAINSKIEFVSKQITQTQTFKKGLLQQMFV
ncbi:MAG: hypothetical protein RL516_301 [Bacteroidota bacterium]|jgi:type I restriction enzyme S subunit